MGTPNKKLPVPLPRVRDLSVKERVRIRARTLAKETTIQRWADGHPVREATAMRLEEACGELGIEMLA